MKQYSIVLLLLCMSIFSNAQNSIRLQVKDTSGVPLSGATVSIPKIKRTAIADSSGFVQFSNLPAGKISLLITHSGYSESSIDLVLPLADNNPVAVQLDAEEEELEVVIVSTTRTSRDIRNVPVRVEVIDEEEIDEKGNMRPANVSMLLHESTGIQVQQTSATSGNASIRIQGLDGRYTQLLKDGVPNYGNFSGGLSVLEIPPLDLKQVEVIKGPASTLYGGGAIAGVVNFVSKTPGSEPVYNFMVNQTNLGGTDFGAFLSGRNKKIGYTLLSSYNMQKAYDVDDDDFTELPKSRYFTVNPKLFFYFGEKTTLSIQHAFSTQYRQGGDIEFIKGKGDPYHAYFETNESVRNNSLIELDMRLKNNNRFTVKQAYSIFNRTIRIPGYAFGGQQQNLFTDITYLHNAKKHLLLGGINVLYDQFREKQSLSGMRRNSDLFTTGIYVQDTWTVNEKLSFENGVRLDVVKKYGAFVLPRISALYKFSNSISTRISGGMGYKTPTMFTERTESIQYQNVLPVQNNDAEKSIGVTADISYKKRIGSHLQFSLNQLFSYTQINDPLVLDSNLAHEYFFINAAKPVRSLGLETNMKFIYRNNYKLFVGYTYTDATARYLNGNPMLTLVPRHKLNLALIYEKEDFLKAGFEAYYTGNQYLSNGYKTPAFWECGIMVEKFFGKISIYLNAENFTDVRQGRYKTVSNAPHHQPSFDEIWTHTEGRAFNGGIKVRL